MLFLEPITLILAALPSSPPPTHGIPAAVWLMLALNVAVVTFFVCRIVGLLRSRRDQSPGDATRSARPTPPEP